MDRGLDSGRPTLTRAWSNEAIRGSWESSHQRSLSDTLVRERYSAWMELVASAESDDAPPLSLIDEWLIHQDTEDPAAVIDAVSNLVSDEQAQYALASPATSLGSTDPETAKSLGKRPAGLVVDNSPRPRAVKRKLDGHPSPNQGPSPATRDLQGVGAFVEGRQKPRRKVKYKPLTHWARLWLPKE